MLPDYLYHYYDASTGPFRSMTDLDPLAAEALQTAIRADRPAFFASVGGRTTSRCGEGSRGGFGRSSWRRADGLGESGRTTRCSAPVPGSSRGTRTAASFASRSPRSLLRS